MKGLDDLRALEAAATPGPWSESHHHVWWTPADAPEFPLASLDTDDEHYGFSSTGRRKDADAALIAAARNALPALLDVADAARAALDPTQCSCSAEMPHSDGDCPVVDLAALRAALARLEAGR